MRQWSISNFAKVAKKTSPLTLSQRHMMLQLAGHTCLTLSCLWKVPGGGRSSQEVGEGENYSVKKQKKKRAFFLLLDFTHQTLL